MTHKCSACGGSGYREDSGAWRALGDFPCPVCLGAGSFSDVMPIQDAFADLETLRRAIPYWREDRIVRAVHPLHDYLWLAGWQGERGARLHHPIETPDQAAACARIAAHAAFRAVPGLRG